MHIKGALPALAGAACAPPATAHELTFMCDDIRATIADLSAKGIAFEGDPEDQGFGVVVTMVLPGGVKVMLYEPKHATAI